MSQIRKLTPAILKRIIAEEKKKLISKPKQRRSNKSTLSNEIKQIKKLKSMQFKKVKEIKKLHELRRRLKAALIKRL